MASSSFLISLGLALGVGYGLRVAGLIQTPLFISIVLAATALGLIIPILKDWNELATDFGHLVVAAASISNFATVILLSLFFSREASTTHQVTQLASFLLLAAASVILIARGGRSAALSPVLGRLQDSTAQIRVRGAALLLIAFVAVAKRFGLQTILAAFIAGAVLALADRDATQTHPLFRVKLEAIGFGVLVPVFFVTSGVKFNLKGLFESLSAMIQVPIYVGALLAVRGLPAWIYVPFVGRRRAVAAGFLQATSLPLRAALSVRGGSRAALGRVEPGRRVALKDPVSRAIANAPVGRRAAHRGRGAGSRRSPRMAETQQADSA